MPVSGLTESNVIVKELLLISMSKGGGEVKAFGVR
jgi:hypothetical protein